MVSPIAFFSVLLLLAATSVNAGLLDIFLWDTDDGEGVKRDSSNEDSSFGRNCSCEDVTCRCCMDLNFTYIDLGGPGCVAMKYVSPSQGIAVNISYGESLLLSDSMKGANPEPACLDMISDLAQMCARFSDLAPTSDGLRWCLHLEPVLFGDVQAQYQLGCFRMGPMGMVPDPPSNTTLPEQRPESTTETSTEETSQQLSEEELIAAVNESAEEGLAFFSNLLGLNFGGAELGANATETEETNSTSAVTDPNQTTPSSEQQRAGRSKLLASPASANQVI
ncbi:uncharacterized protein [Anabrus simplex]|uniref:uncharacterized protein n=1 Tax=Anabrus simplex TaxID=316456 RepID=UPI0035A39F81